MEISTKRSVTGEPKIILAQGKRENDLGCGRLKSLLRKRKADLRRLKAHNIRLRSWQAAGRPEDRLTRIIAGTITR